ncbi:methyltransferase, FxLD system [Streptomyces coelicoflavus]|uniref:methyltransferase, FxLD system n=1 Tax=Streptomyces coelicoflavus TaxID=285562 RepID=UPI003F49CE95
MSAEDTNTRAWHIYGQRQLARAYTPPVPARLGWTPWEGIGPGAEVLGEITRRRVLDIGSGAGHHAVHLAQAHGARVTGIELSPTQHERAVSAHVDVPNVEFVQADVTEYLAETEPFDAAYAIGTLAFIDPHRSLPALRDGLRPGAPLILSLLHTDLNGRGPSTDVAPREQTILLRDDPPLPTQMWVLTPQLWEDLLTEYSFRVEAIDLFRHPAENATVIQQLLRARRLPDQPARVSSIEAPCADRLRAQLIDHLVETGCVRTPRVEEAMRTVPRHLFLPNAPLVKAYGNAPVDTKFDGSGRSISCASQPEIVAMMLEQLDVQPGQKILELGAGSGFNAGVLGYLVGEKGHVTTIDVDEDIVAGARGGLAAASIHNVDVILGDGAVGHAPNAPYDRIEATVGAHGIPHAWLDQLAPGGRLLTPLRLRGSVSRSIAFENQDGAWRSVSSQMNTFMPLSKGIADDPRVFVPLDPDHTVTLVTNGDQKIDAGALIDIFRQPRTEAWTDVTFRGPESAEYLELWLTCSMPNGLSRMPAKSDAVEKGLVTAPYPSSTAVFEGGTLTYLTRRPYSKKAPDGATLYEFGVIGHGPDAEALASDVADQVRTWNQGFRTLDVAFEIQPLDATPLAPKPGRFTFDNPLNRIVIEWQ